MRKPFSTASFLLGGLLLCACSQARSDTEDRGPRFNERDFGDKIPILLSSFEPHSGRPQNNSEFIAQLIPEYQNSFEVIPCPSLPVRYDTAAEKLIRCFEQNPDVKAVLSLGEADDTIEVESFTVNTDLSPVADNTGLTRMGAPIIPGAPQHLPLTLVPYLRNASRFYSPPVRFRYDRQKDGMGTFISNNLAYRFAYFLKSRGLSTPYGFIHVPHAMSPDPGHNPYAIAATLGKFFEKVLKPTLKRSSPRGSPF